MNTHARTASAGPTRPVSRELSRVLSCLWELTKPGVNRLVVATAALGAIAAPGKVEWPLFMIALVGTALTVGSANGLNMVLEVQADSKMLRTRLRPLPSGRLSVEVALGFSLGIGVLGIGMLWAWAGSLTGIIAALALVSYVLIYTPLKSVTSAALYVGAVPGAAPPLLGYSAMNGHLDALAWCLFGLLFIWQVPHFLAIAVMRRDEYAAAKIKVLPVVAGLPAARRAIACSSALMVVVSLLPVALGYGGMLYGIVTTLCGLAFTLYAVLGLQRHAPDFARETVRWSRSLFFASMPYLVIVFSVLALTAH